MPTNAASYFSAFNGMSPNYRHGLYTLTAPLILGRETILSNSHLVRIQYVETGSSIKKKIAMTSILLVTMGVIPCVKSRSAGFAHR